MTSSTTRGRLRLGEVISLFLRACDLCVEDADDGARIDEGTPLAAGRLEREPEECRRKDRAAAARLSRRLPRESSTAKSSFLRFTVKVEGLSSE